MTSLHPDFIKIFQKKSYMGMAKLYYNFSKYNGCLVFWQTTIWQAVIWQKNFLAN